jgi:hypothetical protein
MKKVLSIIERWCSGYTLHHHRWMLREDPQLKAFVGALKREDNNRRVFFSVSLFFFVLFLLFFLKTLKVRFSSA